MSVISFCQSFRIGQRVWAKFVKLNKNNMLSEYYKECSRSVLGTGTGLPCS